MGALMGQIKGQTGIKNAADILKKLDKKGLIKSVKAINKNKAKVWLLVETEANTEVTGGMTGA